MYLYNIQAKKQFLETELNLKPSLKVIVKENHIFNWIFYALPYYYC